MHPAGSEVVICTSGTMVLIQEVSGKETMVKLQPGEYAINDPGVWHTAGITDEAEAIFLTAGKDTQHRPR